MHKRHLQWGVATSALLLSTSPAIAAPIIIENNFIRTAISDDGSLGFNGNTSPGLLYDVTGTGTFDPNLDYLTPGSPWEGFGLEANIATGGTINGTNNNTNGGTFSGSDAFAPLMGGPQDLSAMSGNDVFIRWVGQDSGGNVEIQHDYFFNMDDEVINIETTITALTDLTNVRISRGIDNDIDSGNGGGSGTINQRGFDVPMSPDDIPEEDIVLATGPVTDQTVGLFSDDDVTHNTHISSSWTLDPDTILAGSINSNTGDSTIAIAFSFGDLASGQSESVLYRYVFSETLDSVDPLPPPPPPPGPPPPPPPPPPMGVPEPGSLAMLGAGLAALGMAKRRRRT